MRRRFSTTFALTRRTFRSGARIFSHGVTSSVASAGPRIVTGIGLQARRPECCSEGSATLAASTSTMIVHDPLRWDRRVRSVERDGTGSGHGRESAAAGRRRIRRGGDERSGGNASIRAAVNVVSGRIGVCERDRQRTRRVDDDRCGAKALSIVGGSGVTFSVASADCALRAGIGMQCSAGMLFA